MVSPFRISVPAHRCLRTAKAKAKESPRIQVMIQVTMITATEARARERARAQARVPWLVAEADVRQAMAMPHASSSPIQHSLVLERPHLLPFMQL